MTESSIFFTDLKERYARLAHLHRPVGLDGSNVLLLERKQNGQAEEWIMTPLSSSQILGIRVTQYRSWSSIIAGLIAASIATVIAYFGMVGNLWGPGVFTIPVIMAATAIGCIAFSKCIDFDFEVEGQHHVYTNSVDKVLPVIPLLQDWAKAHHIRVVIDYPLNEVGLVKPQELSKAA